MRKGSLQLSINAIVVLILAITMLGLGLGFMRSTFGGVTEQFSATQSTLEKDRIDRLKEDCRDNVCLSTYSVDMETSDKAEALMVLNNFLGCAPPDAAAEVSIDIDVDECQTIKGNDDKCDEATLQTYKTQSIKNNVPEVIRIVIETSNDIAIDTYKYPISVKGGCAGVTDVAINEKIYLEVNVKG